MIIDKRDRERDDERIHLFPSFSIFAESRVPAWLHEPAREKTLSREMKQ